MRFFIKVDKSCGTLSTRIIVRDNRMKIKARNKFLSPDTEDNFLLVKQGTSDVRFRG